VKMIKPTDGYVYPSMRIAQLDVGSLDIETMAFSTTHPTPQVQFAYKIAIQDAAKDPVGWGSVIFEGSLKELIDLINKAKEV